MPQNSTNEIPREAPNIKVIFRGFVMTRIKHGKKAPALIGAIKPRNKGDACHQPITHIYQIDSEGVTTEFRDFTIVRANPLRLIVGDDSEYDTMVVNGERRTHRSSEGQVSRQYRFAYLTHFYVNAYELCVNLWNIAL